MRPVFRSSISVALLILPLGALALPGCGPDVPSNSDASTASSASSASSSKSSSSSGSGGEGGATTSSSSASSSSSGAGGGGGCMEPQGGGAIGTRAIIFVWDGLRPDSINAVDTPNLEQMRKAGVAFQDNHSTYPTFTMMNSASLATGSFPGTTGFYGNTFWAPGATGKDSAANVIDFNQPVFTEDYAILSDLDTFYNGQLLLVGTLFQAAQAAGKKTAAVGKTGAAFLQDYKRGGVVLDEKMAYPLQFALDLQAASYAVPKLTPNAYNPGQITLAGNNGDPTAALPKKLLADNITSDPTDASGTPYKNANDYMMSIYVNYILPKETPDLSLIWLRNPDSTQHNYGPGTANYKDALHDQDMLLGQIQAALTAMSLDATTNLIIVSDHAHSTVSGPTSLFPLRAIAAGAVTQPDPAGYSVSGDVRLADLLTKAGFTAFDGTGCVYVPVLSGIKAGGSQVYPTKTDDAAGSACGVPNKLYTTGSYKVPMALPAGAIVIAANGGSDYLYVPDHDPALVTSIVSFLQSREEIGAIFVDSKYPGIKGTITLDTIKVQNMAGRNPDIIISYTFDETEMVQGLPGVEFESMFNNRGMHGSFSPIDVHNTLIAKGPDFRSAFADTLPTGNVDVAPTLAFLFGLSLPGADGRPLYEALNTGVTLGEYQVAPTVISSNKVTGLTMKFPTDPTGADVDASKSSYQIDLHTKTVKLCEKSHIYFDYARAVRQ